MTAQTWAEWEISYMHRAAANGESSQEVAEALERSPLSIRAKASQLRIRFNPDLRGRRTSVDSDALCEGMELRNMKSCAQHLQDLHDEYNRSLIASVSTPFAAANRG